MPGANVRTHPVRGSWLVSWQPSQPQSPYESQMARFYFGGLRAIPRSPTLPVEPRTEKVASSSASRVADRRYLHTGGGRGTSDNLRYINIIHSIEIARHCNRPHIPDR